MIDIIDCIKKGKYDENAGIVKRTYYCECKKPFSTTRSRINDTPNFCSSCGAPVREKVLEIIKENDRVVKANRNSKDKAMKLFKEDLFKYCGIENNPKRETAFKFAWDHGHDNGLQEVVNVMENILELIV